MEQKISTADPKKKKKSWFSKIACWFTKSEAACGGAVKKPADASESKDGKICSNGEIRL